MIPRQLEDIMLPGRESMCWDCGNKFLLDDRALKMDRPICMKCDPEVQKTVGIFSELLKQKGI